MRLGVDYRKKNSVPLCSQPAARAVLSGAPAAAYRPAFDGKVIWKSKEIRGTFKRMLAAAARDEV